ncbi:MAG: 4-(cytidine 5'-diphospho)-2-C-methyl-D-erythritol kinase [Prevotella sp.]|nr:4-(cytidine 5'-diphospho)-2-C-methyl-D-erythritol kinase [Prevotella sp.]
MLLHPCAKVNLGLNIVSRRPDGYHNLETVFYPVPIFDTLEATPSHSLNLSTYPPLDCPPDRNLVVRAYKLLAADYNLPPVSIELHKDIPSQAGMGGGSSDGAFMLRLLNEEFQLGIDNRKLQEYATKLGADCPFFITAEPAYATGIGEQLEPLEDLREQLRDLYIAIVKPPVAVSTREAYAAITPRKPEVCCRDVVRMPVSEWRNLLTNDFEPPLFAIHPQLACIKAKLYDMGAVYAQMSGSGSALFGLFHSVPQQLEQTFPDCFTFAGVLG